MLQQYIVSLIFMYQFLLIASELDVQLPFASLIVDLILHAYKADFLQGPLKHKDSKLDKTFDSSFRYTCIDEVMSLKNSWFRDYLYFIFPNEFEIKDITGT